MKLNTKNIIKFIKLLSAIILLVFFAVIAFKIYTHESWM